MSLELQEPKFDRPFKEIFEELRDRIPRYNPSWTNFNESDPGITLLQLFSWLGEMTLFRMGQVPRKNYMKFAQLLGLELLQAKPATVALAFVPDGTMTASIKSGSQYSAAGEDEPVFFETMSDLDVIGAVLSDMVVFADGAPAVIAPPVPGAPVTFYPFGRYPEIGNAVYFGFKPLEGGRPFPLRMSFLALRPTADTRGAPILAGEPDAGLVAPVDLVWEFRPKATEAVWERLNVLDKSVAFTRDGYIQVEGPAAIEKATEPALAGLVDEERYWIRVRLDQGSYLKPPRLEYLRPNVVDAVNLVTEPERILGISAGRAGQSFELPETPVDSASLRIIVRGAPTAEEEREPGATGVEDAWTRVDDFFASERDSKHYLLDPSSGRITLGDGVHGAIPTAGAEITAKVWRHGGGAVGNKVMAGSVTTMITQVAGIESVTNPRAAAGGGDEETVEAFLVRAPAELQRRGRAVTAKDFKALATTIDGVAKARAIPGRHPDYPDIEVPGAITVVIVPDTDEKPPRASAELIRAVCRFLDGYRLITTEVYVASPRFIEVRVEARLFADPTASFDTVSIQAKKRLEKFLDPRAREFGVDVSLAELYRELLGARDDDTKVRSVEDLLVYVDGIPHEIKGPIKVPPDALVYSGEHLIVVRPDTDEGAGS